METRLLHEFLTLIEHMNFTRAAERLNMTQPVLSRHIKSLEDAFGARFLERDTHKVELTPVGKVFAEEARKILSLCELSFSTIQSFQGKGQRSLSIAFLGEATRPFLSTFLGWFNERHADIAIECYDCELDEALVDLEKRACDVAFLIRPNDGRRNKALRSICIFSDPMCVAVNIKHPLARKKTISIRELENWPIIGVSQEALPVAWECNTCFLERYGVEIDVAKECTNLETCCFTLEFNDRAVVMLPKHRRHLLGDRATLLALEEEDCLINVELVWDPEDTNPCIEVFLKKFEEFAVQNSWEDAQKHQTGDGAPRPLLPPSAK